MNTLRSISLAAISAMTYTMAEAEVVPARLFQDGMVLQRNQPIKVWGKADGGEKVSVSFKGKKYTATADASGHWMVTMPQQKAGGPYVMTIGQQKIEDVMVGDVWLCSGQSNIDVDIEWVYPYYTKDIDSYKSDRVRIFKVPIVPTKQHPDDIAPAKWQHTNKETAWRFSALGYFLGQRMERETGVAQGVIECCLGGSPIQSWISLDSIKAFPSDYYSNYQLFTDSAYIAAQSKANQVADHVWNNELNSNDPGVGRYERADLDDSQWRRVDIYNDNWAMEGEEPVTGSLWLRQHIMVDAAHAGKPATLHLGNIYDMDRTYINGREVGVTYFQYPPRRYQVPAGVLKEGDNVVTMRVIVKNGPAYFYKNKAHKLQFADGLELALSTNWLTHKGYNIKVGPLGGKVDTQNQAAMLYNGMLKPLAPFGVSGVVWYQGESNTLRPEEYVNMLKLMMNNWRSLWQRKDMPFCVVQLANFMEPSDEPQETGWAGLRESQRQVCRDDANASLAVAIDLGDESDIHPYRKRDVAERCALALDNMVFGKNHALSAEPTEANKRGNKVEVTLNQPMQNCTAVGDVELLGTDGEYHNAHASVNGHVLTISTDGIANPRAVRYAWKNNPVKANLKGINGLPASPFQIDIK